jgi:hypothetical protein
MVTSGIRKSCSASLRQAARFPRRAAAFRASLKTLEACGAELEEMPGDGFEVEPIWRAINHTAWRARFEKLAAEHPDELSETFLKQLRWRKE